MHSPRPVLLVRHGESVWNRERRWQGRADSPLTDAGRAAAADLAENLRVVVGDGPGPLWASSLRRAHETATIIGERLGLAVNTDDRLVERDVAGWQGLTADEIDARWPGHRAARRWPEGAEDQSVVADRALRALSEIAERHYGSGPPVVITHGGVILSLLRLTPGREATIPNLGGSWFTLVPSTSEIVAGELFGAEPVASGNAPPARL